MTDSYESELEVGSDGVVLVGPAPEERHLSRPSGLSCFSRGGTSVKGGASGDVVGHGDGVAAPAGGHVVALPERDSGMSGWEEEICQLAGRGDGVETIARKCGVTIAQVRRTLAEHGERYLSRVDMEAHRRRETGVTTFHRINKQVMEQLEGLVKRGEMKAGELIALKKHMDEVDPDKVFVKTTRTESVSARVVFTVGDASSRARELGFCG